MTRHTLQPIPKLTLEKINNQTVIPHPPYPPLLLAGNLLRQALELRFVLRRWNPWRFVQHAIKVFVDSVEQKAQELLRVVLVRSPKSFLVRAYRTLNTITKSEDRRRRTQIVF